jgi:hypothetical protein
MGAFGDWCSARDLAEIDYDGQSLQVDAPAVLDGVQVLLPKAAQKRIMGQRQVALDR